jgi:cell wall-associated NlpC family hydrolase
MKAEEFIQIARLYQGCPSIRHRGKESGKNPSGFDCSGFVWFLLNQINFSGEIPRFCNQFFDRFGFTIHKERVQAGDLVFFSFRTNGLMPDHMGVMTDGKHLIHSPGKDGQVVEIKLLRREKIRTKFRGQVYSENPIGFKRIAAPQGRFQKPFFEY